MSYAYNGVESHTNQMEIDHKVCKKIFPKVNNKTSLEIVLERDPNLFLRLHNMKLHFSLQIPEGYMPDLALPAKQFSDLRIELNSQTVNSSTTK